MSDEVSHEIDSGEILTLPGRQTLDIATIRSLSLRSDTWGVVRAIGHFGVMGCTGYLIYLAQGNWWLLIPAMFLHGATIVTMFAPMHECVHKTAFDSRWMNEVMGWVAGSIAWYNFHFYRRYHTWHHRYTQDPERDPELMTPPPATFWQYVWNISGIPFWINKPLNLIELSLGRMDRYQFIAANSRKEIMWSARAQLALYLSLLVVSIYFRTDVVLMYWLLPAMMSQPLLRCLTIVEHTGCSMTGDGLTNTRTTLASFPIRFLMWNMPFHAEHHLYPSIPFWRLPAAHDQLRKSFAHIAPSYPRANAEVIRTLGQTVAAK